MTATETTHQEHDQRDQNHHGQRATNQNRHITNQIGSDEVLSALGGGPLPATLRVHKSLPDEICHSHANSHIIALRQVYLL